MNKVTIRDVYPIPRIDDCLTALGGNQWFWTFDMHAGFWQIGMAEEDRHKTLKKQYYWRGMFRDISQWIAACPKCSAVKTPLPKYAGLLQPITTTKTFEMAKICKRYGVEHIASSTYHYQTIGKVESKWKVS